MMFTNKLMQVIIGSAYTSTKYIQMIFNLFASHIHAKIETFTINVNINEIYSLRITALHMKYLSFCMRG